jgi:hypothetical protein
MSLAVGQGSPTAVQERVSHSRAQEKGTVAEAKADKPGVLERFRGRGTALAVIGALTGATVLGGVDALNTANAQQKATEQFSHGNPKQNELVVAANESGTLPQQWDQYKAIFEQDQQKLRESAQQDRAAAERAGAAAERAGAAAERAGAAARQHYQKAEQAGREAQQAGREAQQADHRITEIGQERYKLQTQIDQLKQIKEDYLANRITKDEARKKMNKVKNGES